MRRNILLLLMIWLLAACAPAAEPETAVLPTDPTATANTPREAADPTTPPDPTAALPATSTPLATSEPAAEAAEEVVEVEEETAVSEQPASVNVITERTPEGAFVLGDPNAPLTFIEYSDFL